MEKQINKIKELVKLTQVNNADYYMLSTSDEFLNGMFQNIICD